MSENEAPIESNWSVTIDGVLLPKESYWLNIMAVELAELMTPEQYDLLLDFRYCHNRIIKINFKIHLKTFRAFKHLLKVHRIKLCAALRKQVKEYNNVDTENILNSWDMVFDIMLAQAQSKNIGQLFRHTPESYKDDLHKDLRSFENNLLKFLGKDNN